MRLYKYYPENINSLKSLSLEALWCSNAIKMNDPTECLMFFDRNFKIEELNELRKIFQKSTNAFYQNLSYLNDEKLSKTINSYRKLLVSKFAFCSLSEKCDDPLMWSHYSSSHQGFAIGIEFSEEDIYESILTKVTYEDSLNDFNLEKLAKFVLEKDNLNEEIFSEIISDLSIKTKNWKYENEWRLWTFEPGYYKLKSNQIKELIFGYNTSYELQALVTKIMDKNINDVSLKYVDFLEHPFKIKLLDDVDDIIRAKQKKKDFINKKFINI